MQIDIRYNKNKDAQWIIDLFKSKEDFYGVRFEQQIKNIPEHVRKNINNLDYNKAIKIASINPPVEYLDKKKALLKKKIIKSFKNGLEILCKDKHYLFNLLNKDFGGENLLPTDKIKVYITSALMSSENDHEPYSCFISLWLPLHLALTVLFHEIFHFYFMNSMYSEFKRAKWTEEEIETLKESLTVVLNNTKYQKGLFALDSGYPEHKKIREKIERKYIPGKLINLLSEIKNNKNYYLYD